MCSRWVMVRFDPLGVVATFATTLLVLYFEISAGLGGVGPSPTLSCQPRTHTYYSPSLFQLSQMLILSSQGLTNAIFWLSRYWSA